MASKTIHTLAYKLLVDSSQFEKGMVASRKELNQARRVMRETITPAEKIQTEFAKLGNLLKKGAIDQDVFNRKAAALRDEYDKATGAAQKRKDAEDALNKKRERGRQLTQSLRTAEEKHVDTLDELRQLVKANAISQETYNRAILKSRNTLPSFIAAKKRLEEAEKREAMRVEMLAKRREKYRLVMLGIAGGVTAGALVAGRKIVGSVTEQIDKMDALAKTAERLGISTKFLTRFQFAAGKTSGLSDDATAIAIEKMTRRVSEAAAGGGEAVKALQEIGLEARSLANSGPERGLMMIAEAMRKVTNQHDLLRIGTKLFDDEQAKLYMTLTQSNSALEAQFKQADRLGATLQDFDASQMTRAKDAVDEMNRALGGFSSEFAQTVAPALTSILNELKEALIEIRGSSFGKRPTITKGATSGDGFAAVSRTVADSIIDNQRALSKTADAIGSILGGESPKDLNLMEGYRIPIFNLFENMDRIHQTRVARETKASSEWDRKQKAKAEADRNKKMIDAQKADLAARRQMKERYEAEQKAMAENKARAEIQFARQRNDMQFQKLTAFRENMKAREQLTTTQSSSSSTGPLESIAAGSSEAFKFLNQTTAARTIEVQLAQEQTEAAKSAVQHLNRIEAVLTEQRERIEERADQLQS